MGNYTSCFYVAPQIAKLVDVHGNLRKVKLPITAAEIMMEEPGHVISPADDDLRRTHRFSALRADENLSAGKLYILIAGSRIHGKLSESEMAIVVESSGSRKKSRADRRSSKVQPALMTTEGTGDEVAFKGLGEIDTGTTGPRLGNSRQWRPVLEPISENVLL